MKTGFSLIELLISLAIACVLVYLLMHTFSSFSVSDQEIAIGNQLQTDLLDAVRKVQDQGRVARSCQKVMVSGQASLVCQTDRGNPPMGNIDWVRFLLSGTALEYQLDTTTPTPTGTFASFRTLVRFPAVQEFTVCGDTELLSSPPTCALEPREFGTRYAALGLSNRFFRFNLTLSSVGPRGQNIRRSMQSSFFIRTPQGSPLVLRDGSGNVISAGYYQW